MTGLQRVALSCQEIISLICPSWTQTDGFCNCSGKNLVLTGIWSCISFLKQKVKVEVLKPSQIVSLMYLKFNFIQQYFKAITFHCCCPCLSLLWVYNHFQKMKKGDSKRRFNHISPIWEICISFIARCFFFYSFQIWIWPISF